MQAKLDIKDETFNTLKTMANAQGISAYQFIREALELIAAYEKGRIAGEQANEQGSKHIL